MMQIKPALAGGHAGTADSACIGRIASPGGSVAQAKAQPGVKAGKGKSGEAAHVAAMTALRTGKTRSSPPYKGWIWLGLSEKCLKLPNHMRWQLLNSERLTAFLKSGASASPRPLNRPRGWRRKWRRGHAS